MNRFAFLLITLAMIAAGGCVVAGWVMNFLTIVRWVGPVTAELVIRFIGIPVPMIGAIMGWM